MVRQTEAGERPHDGIESEDKEGQQRPEAPMQPSLATVKKIISLSGQIEELDRWLEQELAAARERGRDPSYMRTLEADEPGMEESA
jgi:hypothetical protein